MKKTEGKNASIFELNGVPQLSKALPLALQHVVAMIVGCVTRQSLWQVSQVLREPTVLC